MMKKLFCLLALGVALSACEKEPVEEINPNLRTVTFCANFDQTRTFLVGNTLYWDENDVIGGFAQGNTNVEFETDKDQGTGYFTGQIDITNNPDPFYLYYPYQEDAKFSGTTLTTVLPETQPLVANSLNDIFPMVATTSDFEELVRFRNVASVVRFTVISNIDRTIKSLTLTTTDENATIWGTGTVDMADMSDTAEPTLVMTSAAGHNSVKLTSEEGVKVKANEATYFYVVLPAGTYTDGFTVTLSDGMNDTKAAFIKDLKLARNKLIAVKDAIPFDSNGTIKLDKIVINEINEATIYFNQETKMGEVKLNGFTNPKAVTLKLDYTAQLDNGGDVTPNILINGQPYSEDATYDFTMPVKIKLSSEELAYSVEYTAKLSQLTDTGLPVVYVNTPSEITSKVDWTEGCQIYIDAEGRKSWDGTETFEDFAQLECEVKGRGNTTWKFNKKPYAIKLSSKEKVLGMPKHKRWVLLANAIDMSMMRNIVGFEIAKIVFNRNGVANSQGNVWTPRGHSVELVLNGEHKGNYLLCEQIKIDKNRVDIAEADDPTTATSEQGYLIEADRLWGSDETETLWWSSFRQKHPIYGVECDPTAVPASGDYGYTYKNTKFLYIGGTTYTPAMGNTDANIAGVGYGFKFGLKSPDDGDLGSIVSQNNIKEGSGNPAPYQWIAQRISGKYDAEELKEPGIEQYIFDQVNGYYAWETDANGNSAYLNKVGEYIDLNSFVDYFIINEVVMNHELNNPGSVYMHYNPADQKVYAGPIWDLDWTTFKDAAGRSNSIYNKVDGKEADGYIVKYYPAFITAGSTWYCRLITNVAFQNMLKARWAVVKPQLEAFVSSGSVAKLQTYLTKSAEYNWGMWTIGADTNGQNPNGNTNSDGTTGDPDFATAAGYISKNISTRITDLDNLISNNKFY